VVSSLGHKAFIVAMFLKMGSEIDRGMEEVSRAIISVLKGQT